VLAQTMLKPEGPLTLKRAVELARLIVSSDAREGALDLEVSP
jgi:hypothetical protein